MPVPATAMTWMCISVTPVFGMELSALLVSCFILSLGQCSEPRTMKIIDKLARIRPAFSFEFFPPKDREGVDRLFETVQRLKAYDPAYVSVTYGAGGSTRALT